MARAAGTVYRVVAGTESIDSALPAAGSPSAAFLAANSSTTTTSTTNTTSTEDHDDSDDNVSLPPETVLYSDLSSPPVVVT